MLEKALHTTLAAINVRTKMFKRKFGQHSTFNDYVQKLTSKMGLHNRAANQLKGHPLECYLYSPPRKSDLLYIQILVPHFPAIRCVVTAIYEVRRSNATKIQRALQYGHLDEILDIVHNAHTT